MREHVGHKIKLARQHASMTQEDLAEATGISRAYISLLERGKVVSPGIGHMYRIAKSTNVSLGWFGKDIDFTPKNALD